MTDWSEHNKNFGKSPSNPDEKISVEDYGKLMMNQINQSDDPYDFDDNFQQNNTPDAPNPNQEFFNSQNPQHNQDNEIEVEFEEEAEPENEPEIEVEPDEKSTEEKSKKRDQNARIKQKLQELNEANSKLNEENLRLKKTTIEKIDESFHLNHQSIKSEYDKLLAEKKYLEDRSFSLGQEFKNARMNNDIDAEDEALKKRSEYDRQAELTSQRLSKIKSDSENLISEYESFQKNVANVEKEIMKPRRVETIEDYDEEKGENFNEFMKQNTYLDDSFHNPNYSPELVAEASKISAEISRNYKLNNAGDQIGSKKYFNDVQMEINRMLKKSKPMETRTVRTPSSRTAPVSSENTKRVRMRESEHKFLSNVQKEIARAFPDQKDSLTNSFQKSFLTRLKNS